MCNETDGRLRFHRKDFCGEEIQYKVAIDELKFRLTVPGEDFF